MARPDKAAAVAELTERFSNAGGAVLTEYRGLTVKALKELRRSLGEDATYAVSKNTLTTIAARQAGVEGIDDLLVGPTAIAFIDGDPVVVAKGLRDFARNNPQLVIKGGVLDGKPLTPDEVRKLADLESREVLLGKAAGAMKGVLAQAVSLLAAPLSQAARLVAALEKAATENPSLIAGAGAPATAPEDTSEPSNDELEQAAAASEPSNEELDSGGCSRRARCGSSPRRGRADAAPAAESATDAAPAADEITTVAADAAEDK